MTAHAPVCGDPQVRCGDVELNSDILPGLMTTQLAEVIDRAIG